MAPVSSAPPAGGALADRPPASAAAATDPSPAAAADPTGDVAETLAEAFSRRAEVALAAVQSQQQLLQLRLDRIRNAFNASQELRTERLRQANALRDMAIEQAKKDDEILKKYIAMI